jgi:hypothetical protein
MTLRQQPVVTGVLHQSAARPHQAPPQATRRFSSAAPAVALMGEDVSAGDDSAISH